MHSKGIALLILAALLALPALASAYTPWGAIYDAARDERSVSDIAADKKISTDIKATLVNRDGKLGLAVKVYCYLGKVTLLGQLGDDKFKAFAEATAKKAKGARSVSTHWVAPGKEDTTKADLEIAAKLRAALVGDKDISATQVETEVFGGKVYLIGMVRSQKDADKAVAHARAVKGVTGVTSLLVPPKKK
ncbi:MAG: BON domain-containing protein [Proteobacteria bacterium]|nr:BON domain-containing protein [Pseudomonadota bacterium]MBU1594990.1 BON domain-containing protein [Pseudomonadota bacterium]